MIKRRTELMIKVLFLVMCTSSVPTTIAFAEEKVTNVVKATTSLAASIDEKNTIVKVDKNELTNSIVTDAANYQFDASTGTITGYKGNETEVVIPSKINGVAVTHIKDQAFEGYNRMNSIIIPNSVISIGESAFMLCDNLTSVTISDSVTSIGNFAFEVCPKLKNIIVDNDNNYYLSADGVLFNKSKTTIIKCPEGKENTSYIIPNSVTCIGLSAFSRCTSLMTVTIPNSVTSIGEWGFDNCTSLATVTIPNSVTSMGRNAFSACRSLTNVTIPNSVTTIGFQAFSKCTSLTTVAIPSSVTYIDREAFSDCRKLTEVTIPSSVTYIDDGAFSNCRTLTKVTIPSSVTSIGESAFFSCTSLNKVYTSINPIPSYTYINRATIFEDISTIGFYDIPQSPSIPVVATLDKTQVTENKSQVIINKPQTLTPIADHIEIKSDKVEEKDGIITYTGNIAINDCLKLNGKLEKDTKNLTLKGEGQLYLETTSPNFHGVINLYKGKFDLKADGAEILKAAGLDTLKIADLEFSISKLQLISGGVRLGGSLKLPKNIVGGSVTVDTIEIVNGKIGFPSGKIKLPEFKLGKSAIGLSDAYISYDAEKNYFEGAGTLTIPKLFSVNSTVGIENAKLQKVGIGISGMDVAIGASGLFLNSAYGEVDGLATPPLVLTAKMDVSGGPKIADMSVIKGKNLTIKVDMSGVLSGSGELQLMSIPLSGGQFKIESGKGFEASAYINAADIIKGNCNLKVYYKPTLTIQGDSRVSVNIPKIGEIAETNGYFDNEKIMVGANIGFTKGVVWVKYTGEWGVDFNADLQQMTKSISTVSKAISMPPKAISMASNITSTELNTISVPSNAISIDSGMDKALIKITYLDGAGDIVLIAPNGMRITPENSGMNSNISNYIKFENQKTIYYLLNKPQAGQWQYELVNSTFTGLQFHTGKMKSDPVLNFLSTQNGDIAIDVSNTSADIPIQWQCSEADGKIDILYSTKPNDKLGIPIATGIDVSSGSYTWNVDNKIPTGKYYITAVFHSNGIIPTYEFYNRAVIVKNLATPKQPSNVIASASNGNINISWLADTNTDIKGYNIYVSDGINEKVFNVGLYDNYQVVGLENKKSYSIQMTSVNNIDLESEKSAPVNIYLSIPIPPQLNVAWSDNKYLKEGALRIKGSADSDSTVQVFVNDKLAEENLVGSFDTGVTLAEGENEIRVVATKTNGDSTEKINTYWYDSNPPQLSVNDIYDGMTINSLDYVVRGKVEPNVNLLINGEKATETNGEFSYNLSLIQGINNITISATDVAGNKTEFTGTITVNTMSDTAVSLDKPEVK